MPRTTAPSLRTRPGAAPSERKAHAESTYHRPRRSLRQRTDALRPASGHGPHRSGACPGGQAVPHVRRRGHRPGNPGARFRRRRAAGNGGRPDGSPGPHQALSYLRPGPGNPRTTPDHRGGNRHPARTGPMDSGGGQGHYLLKRPSAKNVTKKGGSSLPFLLQRHRTPGLLGNQAGEFGEQLLPIPGIQPALPVPPEVEAPGAGRHPNLLGNGMAVNNHLGAVLEFHL